MTIIRSIRANVYILILCNEVFTMERNGIPLCFTMFSICLGPNLGRLAGRPQPYGIHAPNSKETAKTTYDVTTGLF